MARSACCAGERLDAARTWRYPAVSTSPNRRPRHVASSSTRSRVTPGIIVGDRLPPAEEPVDQGRLADVLPSHDRDAGECSWPGTAHGASSGARSATTASAARSVPSTSRSLVSITTASSAGTKGFARASRRIRARGARRPPPLSAPFVHPAAGALLRRCVQVDLHGRVGEHDRADVAPLHDRAVLTQGTLGCSHHGSDPGCRATARDVCLDIERTPVLRRRSPSIQPSSHEL